jgi:hypothetical protein
VFVTAFAAIVSTTAPGEQPESAIVYAVPEPDGVPIVHEAEPDPDFVKSEDASPVTASLNATSKVIVEELVIVVLGANVVIDGPSEDIVTYPCARVDAIDADVFVPELYEPPPPPAPRSTVESLEPLPPPE